MHLQEYLESGEHLPPELKDFHDQKLFFKWLVWKIIGQQKDKDIITQETIGSLDFVTAQIFTIDYFLWFMAKFGYKLQRIRKKGVEHYDLADCMKEYSKELSREQSEMLSAALKQNKSADSSPQSVST